MSSQALLTSWVFLRSRWAQLRQTGVIGIYLMFVWCSSIESALVSWHLTRRKKKKKSAHCDQLVRNGQMKWKPPHHCCSSINPPLSRLRPVSERVEWSGGLVRLIRSQTAQEHLCYFKIWMWNGARRWIISFSSLWQWLFLSAPEMIFQARRLFKAVFQLMRRAYVINAEFTWMKLTFFEWLKKLR